ncbi:MAG: DUF3850 domain-containing protein [Nanoarchaeota archaeon]|nr:DUF3850 domain-containing protein [Nanoarchaeota archaeon]
MEHKLPTDKNYFETILSGKKKFELRCNYRNINEGDNLIIQERDKKGNLTGRELKKKVNLAIKTKDLNYWPEDLIKKHGYVIAQFE